LLINEVSVAFIDTLPFVWYWTPDAIGAHSLMIRSVDDDGAMGISDTVYVTVEEVTGTTDDHQKVDVLMYPNPFRDELWIETNALSTTALTTIEVFNAFGQRVNVGQEYLGETFRLDFTSVSPGMYFIQLCGPNFMHTTKVIGR
jgi:hypothetical protein